jgi:glycosyltransferase involved in cell wall biosynthesis
VAEPVYSPMQSLVKLCPARDAHEDMLLKKCTNSRILYLIGELRSGGSERQLYYLLRNLDQNVYRPGVVVWNFSETDTYASQIRKLGTPIYSFSEGFSQLAKLRAFCRLVKQQRPEVVHSYSSYLNFAVYWSTRFTEAIGVGSVRSNFFLDWEDQNWWLRRLSARWPRSQIYNSFEAERNARSSKRLFIPEQILVVQNGVDLGAFHHVALPNSRSAHIVGLGSLFSCKRWDRLLRAAAELKQRKFEFSVEIAGDGPLRASLNKQIESLRISDCVKIRGYVTDVQALMSGATFLVHPSDVEGLPNAVMEAMACGRPVVATDVGDVPKLVEDQKTGFIVAREDHVMLTERMAALITNRDLCRRMGEAGRRKAEREFGLDRFVSGTLAAYRAAGWKDA